MEVCRREKEKILSMCATLSLCKWCSEEIDKWALCTALRNNPFFMFLTRIFSSIFSILKEKMNWWFTFFSSVQFSHLVMSNSLQLYGLKCSRLPCPSPTPGACSKSCPSVSNAIQPPHPLSSPPPPAFNISQYQGLFQWVSSFHQVAKVLELQLQHQSSQWIFWTDFL